MGHLYTKIIEAAAHGQHGDNQGDNPRPTSTCARRTLWSPIRRSITRWQAISHIRWSRFTGPMKSESIQQRKRRGRGNSGETGVDQVSPRKTSTLWNAQASGLWQCLPHASHWAYTTWGNLEVCHYNISTKPEGNQKEKQVLGTREAAPWWKHILIKSLYVQFPASISKGSQLPTSSSSRENPKPQASVDTCHSCAHTRTQTNIRHKKTEINLKINTSS